MTLHNIEYEYVIFEKANMQADIDPTLDKDDKEEAAYLAVKEEFPDIGGIDVLEVKEVH